jgi:hypothetical protein
MIDYFKKKLEQLADSLFDPLWARILKLHWSLRALVLLFTALTVYFVYSPESASSALAIGSAVARVGFINNQRIPISPTIRAKMQDTAQRIAATLKQDLSLDAVNVNPLTIAQAVLGTDNLRKDVDTKRLVRFFRENADTSCNCWRDLPGRPQNPVISGWVLTALAEIGDPARSGEIEFLLREQNRDGWWSMYVVEPTSKYASTYATAWALLGLSSQLTKGLSPTDENQGISTAIQKGAAWLLSEREQKSPRWKDYPLLRNGAMSESISGVVFHALHQTIPDQMTQIDRAWLSALPSRVVSAKESDRIYIGYDTRQGWANDDFVQVILPWMLVGTADAYSNGNVLQRAKALVWLEEALSQESVVEADTTPENWWRAELLFALNYLLQRS